MRSIVLFAKFLLLHLLNAKETYKSPKQFLESEVERLNKANTECSLKKITRRAIEKQRLTFLNQDVDHPEVCFVKYLVTESKDSLMWSALGTIYDKKGKKFTSQTNFCFKQASKLEGKFSKYISEWNFLGPFPIGKTEFDGDPIQVYGDIRNLSLSRYSGKEYYSELMSEAKVKWMEIKQRKLESIIQISPSIPWNDLVSSLGSLGITEWQGWLVGDIAVNVDSTLLFQCIGVSTFYVNDVQLTGDVYHRERYWFSVHLTRGVHTVYVPIRTKVAANIKCSFKAMKKTFEILDPKFLPDLYDGYIFGRYFTLPVSNYHPTKWLKNIKITRHGGLSSMIKVKAIESSVSIAPGQTRPIIIKLSSDSLVTSTCKEGGINFEIKISTSEGSETMGMNLRCRGIDQSVVFSFMNHDGSIQHAATIKPIGESKGISYPVMLTLHGTTVPPQNQADSYKYMVNDEFIFGVDGMWLLAPTRHGAHNWEGPGLLTALRSIEALKELVEEASWTKPKVDTEHLIIAGHSMGGHGAWHIATHYPDRVMALVSLAGWIKKEEYGDSNLFFKHDVSTSHTDPIVKLIMESCISENDADKHVSNLKGMPVFVRIGAADKTVHPYYSRRMVRLLHEASVQVQYTELPGKEHWWWDTSKTNDGGAVNDEPIRDFVTKHLLTNQKGSCSVDGNCENEEGWSKYQSSDTEFVLSTVNPALGSGLKGLRILQQIIPYRTSDIKVKKEGEKITLITTNVKRFELQDSSIRGIDWENYDIYIDDTHYPQSEISQMYQHQLHYFKLRDGKWLITHEDIYKLGERGPENLGPARRIAEKDFILVVGSSGNNEDINKLLLESSVYIANLFLLTSDTIANIVLDIEITANQLENKNIILLGSPEENKFTGDYLSKLPVRLKDNSITLGTCKYTNQTNTGLFTLAPHGQRNLALILFGSNKEGLKDVISLAKPTIPPMTRSPFSNLLPDYVISGSESRWKGPGGWQCAGFWDNEWKYQQYLSSCIC
ncbi:hypothetical protein LOTGIDRAFT_159918 [Lottia gigantea]|uniref:Peptidase S9 prolyl oligopeptidase catalytic domain-containing protein n=1 Tax=Lottia gigantea TaxID=225164 RepID=V4AS16_LOTGI|nr:hypothetical protein LOTGIDRAFT_159918 [Lottia gigantea]ESO96501.1 hypothetical protein LOTGIDRAFT_159918 [Lottia gigantea]